jgi:hypothetical protein
VAKAIKDVNDVLSPFRLGPNVMQLLVYNLDADRRVREAESSLGLEKSRHQATKNDAEAAKVSAEKDKNDLRNCALTAERCSHGAQRALTREKTAHKVAVDELAKVREELTKERDAHAALRKLVKEAKDACAKEKISFQKGLEEQGALIKQLIADLEGVKADLGQNE